MFRRSVPLLAFGLVLVGVAWIHESQFDRSGDLIVSYTDYCQVTRGMSRNQVQSIFGGRPTSERGTSWGSEKGKFTWEGCAGSADVEFDDAGMVVNKWHWPKQDWESLDAVSKQQIHRKWRHDVSSGIRIRD
jgi:hypothetical protein